MAGQTVKGEAHWAGWGSPYVRQGHPLYNCLLLEESVKERPSWWAGWKVTLWPRKPRLSSSLAQFVTLKADNLICLYPWWNSEIKVNKECKASKRNHVSFLSPFFPFVFWNWLICVIWIVICLSTLKIWKCHITLIRALDLEERSSKGDPAAPAGSLSLSRHQRGWNCHLRIILGYNPSSGLYFAGYNPSSRAAAAPQSQKCSRPTG